MRGRWRGSWMWIQQQKGRRLYWKYLRSRVALASRVQKDEMAWSGKGLHPDDVQEYVDMWKEGVRY